MDVLHEILFPAVNAVFLGEAGCGKSEIAMELALRLAALGINRCIFLTWI